MNATFPSDFVPTLKHNIIKNLNITDQYTLQTASLYRFLNFTHKLEMMVVNAVTANIALGLYDLVSTRELRLDAHRIYTDKAYHALFSFELMSNITKNEEIRQHCQARSPAFLERLHKITNGEVPEKRAVWELFFAIVSEMLITSTLRDARDHPKIDNGIILMIDDHARDEARHHVFYKRIFEIVWPQLSRDNKELVVQSLPMLILAYTMPDESAIKSELLSIGLSCDQSEEIYSDTYSYEKISALY